MSGIQASQSDKVSFKLSMRIDPQLWAAWGELATRAAYDPGDYIKIMMIRAVTGAQPPVLTNDEHDRLARYDLLNDLAVQIAHKMFDDGDFTQDFTLHVFRRAMENEQFVMNYKEYIGSDDPYRHGLPFKEINRDLGWRIKNSVPVEVVKADDGKPVERRNLKGEVIQSYTLLRLRENG